jgi:hypothetical protein
MRVPVTILLRCLCQARTMFGSCICVWGFLSLFYYMYVSNQANVRVNVYVHESSCHYSIKMSVPSEDSIRVIRNPHIHIHVSNTVLAWHMHLNRRVAETLIHIYITRTLSWLGTYILIEEWQEPSYTYKWLEQYMCMRVSATIILRCIYQAMTVFGLCICVWGFLQLFY